MQRLGLIGGWVLVVLLATTLTWQVVGAADDQVSERPASPLNVSAPTGNGAPRTTTTTSDSGSFTSVPATTTTSIDSTPTTLASPTSTSTTAPQSTTTTTVPADWTLQSTTTLGGTVVVKYRSGEVVLQTATPKPGFRTDIENSGPPEVEVEFESETLKVEFSASWGDDSLEIEVKEEEHSD